MAIVCGLVSAENLAAAKAAGEDKNIPAEAQGTLNLCASSWSIIRN